MPKARRIRNAIVILIWMELDRIFQVWEYRYAPTSSLMRTSGHQAFLSRQEFITFKFCLRLWASSHHWQELIPLFTHLYSCSFVWFCFCRVFCTSSYFILNDNCIVLSRKSLFSVILWSCRMMPGALYYIWKWLGTGTCPMVTGTTSRYRVLPLIPGTYPAHHCGRGVGGGRDDPWRPRKWLP